MECIKNQSPVALSSTEDRRRFQWVVFQLDELRKCLKSSQIHQTLANLPKDLNITYGQNLSRIDDLWHQDVSRVLECMVYSSRPLGTKELADFLAIDIEQNRYDNDFGLMDSSDIFIMCPNLITADTSVRRYFHRCRGEPVTFVHSSVKEYLLSKDGAAGPAARISFATEVHGRIAEMCLVYLIENIQPRARRLSIGDLMNNKPFEDERFPLARYAATQWTHHARGADPGNHRLNELILRFLQSDVLFKTWLEIRVGPRWVSFESPDPLYHASGEGLAHIVQLMLCQGADLHRNHGHPYTKTTLSVASENDYPSVVKVLIDHGALINDPTGGVDVLNDAAAHGNLECVKLLLAGVVDVQGCPDRHCKTALDAAIQGGHLKVAEFLLEKGADPFIATDRFSVSPFWLAAYKKHKVMVESILARGKKAKDAMGVILAYAGDIAIAQLLLDHGADVNEVESGFSVLRLSQYFSRQNFTRPEVPEFLMAHGAVLDSNMRKPVDS